MFSWNLVKSFRSNWNCTYPLQHSIAASTWPHLHWNIFYFFKRNLIGYLKMIEIEYVGNTVCYYANVDLNIKKTSVLLNHTHCPNPNAIYLLKDSNKNAWTRCEICSKLTIKTPERRQWHCSVVFIVNCGHLSHLVICFYR